MELLSKPLLAVNLQQSLFGQEQAKIYIERAVPSLAVEPLAVKGRNVR
jgi:hypothetical protein